MYKSYIYCAEINIDQGHMVIFVDALLPMYYHIFVFTTSELFSLVHMHAQRLIGLNKKSAI